MKYELTNQEIDFLLSRTPLSYEVVTKWKIYEKPYDFTVSNAYVAHMVPEKSVHYCHCTKAKAIPQYTKFCKYCSTPMTTAMSLPSAIKDAKKIAAEFTKEYNLLLYQEPGIPTFRKKKSAQRMYYAKIHPENTEALLIYKLKPYVQMEKDGTITKHGGIESVLEVIPGGKSRALIPGKEKETEIKISEFLRVSRQSLTSGFDIYYEDCETIVDFMLKNKEMSKMTGVLDCFNQFEENISRSTFFLLYMVLYASFPVIELLVKMGKAKVVVKILVELKNCANAMQVDEKLAELNKLINPDTTKGKAVLRIPPYIVDYLCEKNLDFKYYLTWADIYELSGNLSKENFEKLFEEDVFHEMIGIGSYYRTAIHEVPSVMKYGYSFAEIVNYYKKTDFRFAYRYLMLLEDYNRMCDLMNISVDKFPSDLTKAHDNLVGAFNIYKEQRSDGMIAKIAENYSPVVEKINNETKGDYIIAMPKNVQDVVDEGQQMHNCVGSYIQSIVENRSVIFFVRKKEEPSKSFITAEYAGGRLRQFYYHNNITVTDTKLLDLGRRFCSLAKLKGLDC